MDIAVAYVGSLIILMIASMLLVVIMLIFTALSETSIRAIEANATPSKSRIAREI